MNDSDELEPAYKRYHSDRVFHSLVQILVQAIESGRLNHSDIFSAIKLADRIVFENQTKLMEEWHDRM